uniref:Uncharacterized protein n=1 Tax=Fagus sylvatica TaxID=28930 RepID=A0A2N9J6G1_FAGSY
MKQRQAKAERFNGPHGHDPHHRVAIGEGSDGSRGCRASHDKVRAGASVSAAA